MSTPDSGYAEPARAGQGFFEERFHHERGWRSPGDATAYAAEGEALQRLLTARIGRWWNVELDLWPARD